MIGRLLASRAVLAPALRTETRVLSASAGLDWTRFDFAGSQNPSVRGLSSLAASAKKGKRAVRKKAEAEEIVEEGAEAAAFGESAGSAASPQQSQVSTEVHADAKHDAANDNQKKAEDEAKLKSDVLAMVLSKINKQYGKGTVSQLGARPSHDLNRVISTGVLSLDDALGCGGLPQGRIIEIFGPEASGKTSLALSVIAEAQKKGGKCMFVDAEHALDSEYVKGMGVDLDSLYITQPDCGEDALEIVDNIVRSGAMSVIVVDSVSALVPKNEIEGEIADEKIGLQARLMSRALRKLTPSVSKTNTILIFINQIRLKIGVMFGSPETTSGGQALKFYSSVRLDVRKSDTIKASGGEVVGTVHKVKVVKNKVGPPFQIAAFSMKFGEGINRANEIINSGLNHGVIETKGAFYYATMPGEEKFILGQGREKTMDALSKDVALAKRLIDAIVAQRAKKHAAHIAKISGGDGIEGSSEAADVNAVEVELVEDSDEIEPDFKEELSDSPLKGRSSPSAI